MYLVRNKKGYLYTIEVMIAAMIIFVSLIFSFRTPPTKPDIELPLLKQQAWNALEYLDYSCDLRTYVLDRDEVGLEETLKDIITKKIKFETEICMAGSGCSKRNVPGNKEVVVVDYYVVGQKKTYDPERVRIYLWTD